MNKWIRPFLAAMLLVAALFADRARLRGTVEHDTPPLSRTALAPAPSTSGRTGVDARHIVASRSERLRQRLIAASSFKAVHDELIARDPTTLAPHEQFYLAFILERCRFAQSIPAAETQAFALNSTVQAGDPELVARAKRRIARRGFAAMCAGVPIGAGVDGLVADLYALAAEGGDPRARAWRLQRELEDAGTPQPGLGFDLPAAPDARQQQRLLDILASGDPMAVAFAGPLLTRGYDGFGIAVGPQRITPSIALQGVMWDLLACELGANCGPDRLEVAFACASAHRCGAASYYDHLQRHVLTPQDLQDFARMRPHLEAGLRHGDWSGLHLLDRNAANYTGSGTRRFSLGG